MFYLVVLMHFFANIVGGNFINNFHCEIITFYTNVLLALSDANQSIYSLLSILKDNDRY